jgi:hypothetical protein
MPPMGADCPWKSILLFEVFVGSLVGMLDQMIFMLHSLRHNVHTGLRSFVGGVMKVEEYM